MTKKIMQWEVRKMGKEKWGVFLQQKYCKTDEPVCYGVAKNKETAQSSVDRMNDPNYWNEEDE